MKLLYYDDTTVSKTFCFLYLPNQYTWSYITFFFRSIIKERNLVCFQLLVEVTQFSCCQPEDYEPPFFKCCAENEAINIWNKNPLKMELGNVNSKHLVLALKVKGNKPTWLDMFFLLFF